MKPSPWRVAHVPTCFVDPVTGKGVHDNGKPLAWTYEPRGGRLRVPALLETAHANGCARVFLTGTKPASAAWLDETADGWRPNGHFYELRDPCGRWLRTDGSRQAVEVRRVASWLGEGDYTPEVARAGMALLHVALDKATRGRVGIMASPAATGQALWAASLSQSVRDSLDEQLADELAELVRSTSPQHREEVIGACHDGCDAHLPAPRGKVGPVHYLDAVFMYAACCRELGIAPAGHLEGERYAASFWQQYPHARARYRARVTVPDGWAGPGLVPVKMDDGARWHYPNRPGWSGVTWCDAAELHLAAENGWRLEPVELVRFAPGRPLDAFADRVVRLRELVAAERSNAGHELAAAGMRSLFIRTLGAFHSRGRDRSYVVPVGEPLPAGVTSWDTRPDGSRVYTARVPLTGAARAFLRPELSAQVWARARVRVARRMLTVEPARLVAVWGDALYIAGDDVGEQGERPGEFRVKRSIVGPVARPAGISELLKLRDRMRGQQ